MVTMMVYGRIRAGTIAVVVMALLLMGDGGMAFPSRRRAQQQQGDEGGEDYDYPGPGFEWRAPGPNDVRGPCPIFNAFANHGLVNRNGVDIPVDELFELTYKFSDTHPDFFTPRFAGTRALGLFHFNDDGVEVVTLSDLYSHNAAEHDSSLVRADAGFGFEESLDMDVDLLWGLLNTNPGSDYITIKSLWRYQRMRMMNTLRKNPTGSFTTVTRSSIPAEKVFVLKFGQHPKLRKVSKSTLLTLMGFERIPADYVPFYVQSPRLYDPTRFPETAQWKYTYANGTVESDILIQYTANFDAIAPTPLAPPVPCTNCE